MVEGARLERVYAGNRIGGSNPLASARRKISPFGDILLLEKKWRFELEFVIEHSEITFLPPSARRPRQGLFLMILLL